MYDELIKNLRMHHCDAKEDDTQEVCEECAYDVIIADKSVPSGIASVCVCGLMHRAADAIEELLDFAHFVASNVVVSDEEWDNNMLVFPEVASRKLNKLGIVEKDGACWSYEPPKEET